MDREVSAGSQYIGPMDSCPCGCGGMVVLEGYVPAEVPEWYKQEIPINPAPPMPDHFLLILVSRRSKKIIVEDHNHGRRQRMTLEGRPGWCTIGDFLACYVLPELYPEEEDPALEIATAATRLTRELDLKPEEAAIEDAESQPDGTAPTE